MFNFASVSNSSIGEIRLDVTQSEEHESDLTITENPIESGAKVVDHAYLNPKTITISGTMVDHSHVSASEILGSVLPIRGITDFLDVVPIPGVTKAIGVATHAIAKAQTAVSMVRQVGDAIADVKELAPWIPDFGISDLLGSDGGSRVQKCYSDLITSQKNGEPITIKTQLKTYENMLIQKVAVSQDKVGSAIFTISAREIFIVENVYTKGKTSGANSKATDKTPSGKVKSGRAKNQASTKSNLGNTKAKPLSTAGSKASAGAVSSNVPKQKSALKSFKDRFF